MAQSCPVGFDATRLRVQVLATYEHVARAPHDDFHFHRGAAYASELLGYDAAELALLPRLATDRFAGVGNPFAAGEIPVGARVLDHACGAGTDLLLAARRTGPAGHVIGVDMTPGMCRVAMQAAREAGLDSVVDVRAGLFESLPVATGCVDVVISNGVLNLATDKARVIAEVVRVLRPGGQLFLADVVVRRELSLAARTNPDLWAACIAGALTEAELHEVMRDAGLTDVRVAARYDSFAGTSAEQRVSSDLRVAGLSLYARKRWPA